MYTVSQSTIMRSRPDDRRWDICSDCDERYFESLEEAQRFYDSIDLQHDWMVEKDCKPSFKMMEHVVFAKELWNADEWEDEYGDTILYAEYGIEDYRKKLQESES